MERIVETKYPDAVTADELAIREVNLGTYAFEAPLLWAALDAVEPSTGGERYLTGVLPRCSTAGRRGTHTTADVRIAVGVNDRAGLMEAERSRSCGCCEPRARGRDVPVSRNHDPGGGGRGDRPGHHDRPG